MGGASRAPHFRQTSDLRRRSDESTSLGVRRVLVLFAIVALLVGITVPADAARGGGGHGGGGHHGGGAHGGFHHGFHGHGFHGGGCCVFSFGVGLGYPYYGYPYYGYPYYPYYPYDAAYPAYTYTPPPVAQNVNAQPLIQREVVYPNGKYVLYGDGVTQPYKWVWVPAAPAPPTQ